MFNYENCLRYFLCLKKSFDELFSEFISWTDITKMTRKVTKKCSTIRLTFLGYSGPVKDTTFFS